MLRKINRSWTYGSIAIAISLRQWNLDISMPINSDNFFSVRPRETKLIGAAIETFPNLFWIGVNILLHEERNQDIQWT